MGKTLDKLNTWKWKKNESKAKKIETNECLKDLCGKGVVNNTREQKNARVHVHSQV